MTPAGGRRAAAVAACAALALGACVEWLEMPDPDAAPAAGEAEGPRVDGAPGGGSLPSAPARVDGRGPLVPGTPGLRVPDGYWTRVRLDVADLWMPWSWASLQGAAPAGDVPTWTLRLLAVSGPAGTDPLPELRAVVPIAVAPGTRAEDLVGLTFGAEALRGATVSVRTAGDSLYLVELSRVAIDGLTPTLVGGTLDGVARRGSRGQRERPFRAGFVALRAQLPAQ